MDKEGSAPKETLKSYQPMIQGINRRLAEEQLAIRRLFGATNWFGGCPWVFGDDRRAPSTMARGAASRGMVLCRAVGANGSHCDDQRYRRLFACACRCGEGLLSASF
jgi:hypothetical protein